MKNILITGAGGQLGQALTASVPSGLQAVSASRAQLDITDLSSVFEYFSSAKPDGVINAAAYTAVDTAETEPEAAERVNTIGAGNLAKAAREFDIPLVHVSTDFVFNGHDGAPYVPEALKDPQSVYGKTKAEGEDAILAVSGLQSRIIRTAWVYGGTQSNFVTTMLRLMQERDKLGVVADQVGTPTNVSGLASACWFFLDHASNSHTGSGNPGQSVYHWTDAGVASWYDFAVAIQEEALQLGLLNDKIPVTPLSSAQFPTPAARPSNSLLDKTSTWAAMNLTPEHWRGELRAVLGKCVSTYKR